MAKSKHPFLTIENIADIVTLYQTQVNDFTNVTPEDLIAIKNKFNYQRY